jgi:hypothetical protein
LSLDFSEINRVRLALFHHKGNQREELALPDGIGTVQTFSEKLYVPSKEHPDVCYFYSAGEIFCHVMVLCHPSEKLLKGSFFFQKNEYIMDIKAYNFNLYIKGTFFGTLEYPLYTGLTNLFPKNEKGRNFTI